jgi:hypothetical protein
MASFELNHDGFSFCTAVRVDDVEGLHFCIASLSYTIGML